ncbi:hypothetical protein LSAT2_031231, partial [Lamellibrachia satsuma]
VYMFALAVADSAVCVGGIVLSTAHAGSATAKAILYVINMSIFYSMLLLVSVSIERLIAVRRPHSFTVNAERARKTLIIIAVAAVVFNTVHNWASLMQYEQFIRVYGLCVLFVCILTMTTCYILIAVTLIGRARASRSQIAVQPGSSEPRSSHMFSTVESLMNQPIAGASNITTEVKVTRPIKCIVPGPSDVTTKFEETSRVHSSRTTIPGAATSAPTSSTNKIVAKERKTSANVALLFIITFVFVVCWIPSSLDSMGFSIPREVQLLFILNSVVNPFIYGVASAMFREDARKFYDKTRVKLSACYN